MTKKEVSKKQLLKVIDELTKQPDDKVRLLGDLGIGVVGAGLGAAAAGTVASAAGVTTVASLFGYSFVAATPVGWIVGVAAAGGGLAYGISRLIRNGGMSEGRKRELLQVYQDQLRTVEAKERAAHITSIDRTQFIMSLREIIDKEAISTKKAFHLIEAVESGKMPVSEAYKLVSAILREKNNHVHI